MSAERVRDDKLLYSAIHAIQATRESLVSKQSAAGQVQHRHHHRNESHSIASTTFNHRTENGANHCPELVRFASQELQVKCTSTIRCVKAVCTAEVGNASGD